MIQTRHGYSDLTTLNLEKLAMFTFCAAWSSEVNAWWWRPSLPYVRGQWIQPDQSAVGTEVWLYHYATENELPVLISRDRSVSKCFPLLPYTFINRLILISIFSIGRLLFQSCAPVGRLFMQHPWLGWSSLDVINSDKSKHVLWDRYMSCTNDFISLLFWCRLLIIML